MDNSSLNAKEPRNPWGILYSCAVFVLCTAAVSADPPVRLRLTFESDDLLPPAIRNGAVLEASRIWEPYGIVVDAGDTTICTANDMALAVAVDFQSGNENGWGLGEVRFASDGTPDSKVTLHYRAIAELVMSATAVRQEADRWPAAFHDQAIARALGRALAHEIGHVVLRWPHHPTSGLMRGQFAASAIADPDRTGFALTANDQARLHIAVSAFLQPADEAPPASLAAIVDQAGCLAF